MLAIIIPYYKINFFKETLLSVENQTDKRFNLYIGNDASPNNPEELIATTLLSTSYFYKEYESNLGGTNLALQWERVIKESKGEDWLMILGDDDILPKNFAEEFYKNKEKAEKQNISLMKFSQEAIDENGKQIRKATQLPDTYPSARFLQDRLTYAFPNSLSEHVFTRKVFEKYCFKKFPLAWHSDDLAILEFADLKKFLFVKEAVVKVRISTESISGQDNNDPRKHRATYEFLGYLLKNYSTIFSKEFVELLIKRYREVIWRNKFPIEVNFTKIYFRKRMIVRAFYSLKMTADLKKRALSNSK